MTGKLPEGTGRRIKLEIPKGARVALVGRTAEDCETLAGFLRPWIEGRGGSLKVFSQIHQMEELGGERPDVLVLDFSLGPTARDTVAWTVERSNAAVVVYEFEK